MPATCCIFRYFVTFTVREENTDYEVIYTASISSAYGRQECLVVGAKHTAHLFILTSLSLITFQFHFLERLTVGDFLNLKWFSPLAPRPQKIFMFPDRNIQLWQQRDSSAVTPVWNQVIVISYDSVITGMKYCKGICRRVRKIVKCDH